MRRIQVGLTASVLLLTACSTFTSGPVSMTPTSRETNLVELGDSIAASGDVKAAEDTYKQAIAASNGSVAGYMALADLYAHTNRRADAEKILDEALKVQPKNETVLIGLSNLLINDHEPAKALPYLNRAALAAPQDWRAFNSKGVALDAVGKYNEAQPLYKKALTLRPADPAYVKNNLALSYILAERYDDAISLLTPLANAKDAPAIYRQNLAMAYGLKGDYKKALALGLKDLPEDEAKANIEFYRYMVANKPAKKAAIAKAKPVTAKPAAEDDETDSDTAVTPVAVKALPSPKPAAKSSTAKPAAVKKPVAVQPKAKTDDDDDDKDYLDDSDQPILKKK